jgi:ketosteroid isomerase-like protein
MKIQEHPNALLVRQAWLAVAHSDIEALQEFWAEDIVWHATARSPWQGDKYGIASVFEYLAQLGEHEGSTDISLVSVMANDTYGALIIRVGAKQEEEPVQLDTLLLCRFVDRRIQEVWSMALEPKAVEEFWER